MAACGNAAAMAILTMAAPLSGGLSSPKQRRHSPSNPRRTIHQSYLDTKYASNISPMVPRAATKTAMLYDLFDQEVPYEQAWKWQKKLVEEVYSSESGGGGGAAVILQHPPVYTLGAGSTEDHLKFDPSNSPLPLFRTERGGEVTYHGPGQLVLYPVLNLKLFRTDLHWYLRSLEEVVIRALEEVSGLHGERVPGLTGVWVDGKKVAAIGVRATRWITYHGLALNVTTDLAPFKGIVPCGIADKPVSSVMDILLQDAKAADPFIGEADLLQTMGPAFQRELLIEYKYGLVAAMEDVFELKFTDVDTEAVQSSLHNVDILR